MKGDFGRMTFDPRKHYRRVQMQQGRVQVEADWNEQAAIQQRRIEVEARDVIGASGAPSNDAGFQITLNQGKLTIGKGRFYVDGMLCENESDIAYLQQPDLPDAIQPTSALTAQQYGVVYLDVWERHITALDDPRIREVALGGPDTASRGQTVWQVKILPVSVTTGTAAGAAAVVSCGSKFPQWDALLAPSTATLNARTQPAGPEGLCLIPPSAGYQRLENQLYRVEIHKPGALGGATFKWSRDNGSVVTSIEKITGLEVTVSDVGPDTVLGFANGQWVELVDDRTELLCLPGTLVQIDKVDAATRVVTLKAAPPAVDLARRPKLRRWDGLGELKVETPAVDGGWLTLEGGVQVRFAAGTYKSGDYWVIPARTATGEIEWPPYQIPNVAPLAQPPHGVAHHYGRLALVQMTSAGLQVIEDCRPIFVPLTEIRDEPGIKVTGVNVLKPPQPPTPPQPLRNDSDVSVLDFVEGIDVLFDNDYFRDVLLAGNRSGNHPICFLTLDLPFPASTADRGLWGEGLLGFQSIVLSGKVVAVSSTTLRWVPEPACKAWLRDRLFQTTQLSVPDRLLVRLTLKGNFVWSAVDPTLYLDGEVFGFNAATRAEARLPSGNGMRGGDLEMWFWLMEPPPLVKIAQIKVNTSLGVPPRLLSDMTSGTGNKITVFEQDGPNVLEVQFNNAVNSATVVDGTSFVVTRSGVAVNGTIVFSSSTVMRWTKTVKAGEPSFLIGGLYQVQMRADGTTPVTGAAGSLLDGELIVGASSNKVILPSGNNVPGGTATFQIDVIPPPR
jgi:hypothetical protein